MKAANFWKSSCYRPIRSQRKKFIDCKKSVKQTLWTLENWFLTFVFFDRMRKIAQNLFFTGKIAFLFKKFCFQQPLRSWRNDLSFSTVNVRLAFELIEIVPWGLSNSKTRWKIGQKFFLTGKNAFFSKICVFNNLSSPGQTILVFPQ